MTTIPTAHWWCATEPLRIDDPSQVPAGVVITCPHCGKPTEPWLRPPESAGVCGRNQQPTLAELNGIVQVGFAKFADTED